MKMLLVFKNPWIVAFFYGALVSLLYALGAFLLSDGWDAIDRSPQRNLLYAVMLYILPGAILIGVIHFLSCVMTALIAIRSFICAVISGLLGVVFLHFSVEASDDPMASMAYVAVCLSYCAFAVVGFVLAAIAQRAWNRIGRKSHVRAPDVNP